MYIQKAEITNIKSIEKFEIKFKKPAGWHVLIGDNGSGKSTIVRSIALALIGQDETFGLKEYWGNWIGKYKDFGTIRIEGDANKIRQNLQTNFDIQTSSFIKTSLIQKSETGFATVVNDDPHDQHYFSEDWFSCAFGPYRRFGGGSPEWNEIYDDPRLRKLAAQLSIFDESVALTEPIKWLIGLFNTSNDPTLSEEERAENKKQLENLKNLINSEYAGETFLPNNTKLERVNSKGVFFKDGNGATIAVNQMSDGYRSILSLTFELIRQLLRVYGSEKVFKNIEKGEMFIDFPGVVLIDEIDAHLHPTWQTRIGQWFLKYFPQLQFIVTTHSPLVCRACEKGSIWRLAAPGSNEESGEVTGVDRDRLIYGNILDAYGTGVFGENTSISQDSNEMLNRLSELNVKSMMGLINDKENGELQDLRTKFPTENAIKK